MKLFNSKSNKIETFIPRVKGKVNLYVCGPTVYNHAHIGNARPVVVFDLLRRVLQAQGYEVTFVSNFTDVDDKIIKRAIEESTTEQDIANRYIEAYEQVRIALNADDIQAKPRVTEVMDDIIAFIGDLIDNDYAYVVGGDVYFRVGRIDTYGQISHQKIEELRVGARIEENTSKENPLDFVLWKQTDEGIHWDSPWSKGRPGWHTECVVMIYDEFGGPIDIHGGGQDLKFPHHENESAQAHAHHHHDLANYWVHNAMLKIDGEKMSKSLGNVVWAKDFIDTFGGNVTRWLLLSTHYRLVLNVSDDVIQQSQNEINRIESAFKQASLVLTLNHINMHSLSIVQEYYDPFLDALKDDLNIANAIAVLFETIKQLNQSLRVKEVDYATVGNLTKTVNVMLEILGIDIEAVVLQDEEIELYQQWESLKKEKNFEEADRIRNVLIAKGIL